MTQETRLITAKEFAAELDVHPETVRRWVRDKKLRCVVMPSGRIKLYREDAKKLAAGGTDRQLVIR